MTQNPLEYFTGKVPVRESDLSSNGIPVRQDMPGSQKDERIHLRDRGKGRDLGQNPAFTGGVPHTRSTDRNPGYSVGGYGSRDEQVTSFAATSIPFVGASGVIVNGNGALRGLSFSSLSSTVRLNLRNGTNVNSPLIYSGVAVAGEGFSKCLFFGDMGILFNNLYAEFVTPPSDFNGAVWIATTE